MTDEKPLNVRVAEALGCRLRTAPGCAPECGCEPIGSQYPHGTPDQCGDYNGLAPYGDDSEWGAFHTVPLAQARRYTLAPFPPPSTRWRAIEPTPQRVTDSRLGRDGDSIPEAIANLILAQAARQEPRY